MLNTIKNRVKNLKQIEISYIKFSIIYVSLSYIIFNSLNLDKFIGWFVVKNSINYMGLITFMIIGLLVNISFFMILAHRWTIKLFAIIFTIFSASSSYFIATYNVAIDTTMIENVIHTDTTESLGLLSVHMLPYILLISIVVYLIVFVKINFGNGVRYLYRSTITFILSFGLAVALLYWQFIYNVPICQDHFKFFSYSYHLYYFL